ncbi:MAG: hypothetical protein ACE5Q3_11070 [Alphaproteobacteria bacterium]
MRYGRGFVRVLVVLLVVWLFPWTFILLGVIGLDEITLGPPVEGIGLTLGGLVVPPFLLSIVITAIVWAVRGFRDD